MNSEAHERFEHPWITSTIILLPAVCVCVRTCVRACVCVRCFSLFCENKQEQTVSTNVSPERERERERERDSTSVSAEREREREYNNMVAKISL